MAIASDYFPPQIIRPSVKRTVTVLETDRAGGRKILQQGQAELSSAWSPLMERILGSYGFPYLAFIGDETLVVHDPLKNSIVLRSIRETVPNRVLPANIDIHPIIAVSKSGELLALAGLGGIRVLDQTKRKALLQTPFGVVRVDLGAIVKFSINESQLIVTHDFPKFEIWDLKTQQRTIGQLQIKENAKPSVQNDAWNVMFATGYHSMDVVSQDGSELLLTSSDVGVHIHDFSGSLISTLSTSQFCRGACIAENQTLAAWFDGDTIVTYDLTERQVARQVTFPNGKKLAISHDGSTLAVAHENSFAFPVISLFDLRSGKLLRIEEVVKSPRWTGNAVATAFIVWLAAAWRFSARGGRRTEQGHLNSVKKAGAKLAKLQPVHF